MSHQGIPNHAMGLNEMDSQTPTSSQQDLTFTSLFVLALAELPQVFNFPVDLQTAGKDSAQYLVPSLAAVSAASDRYIGARDEVLQRHLYESIYDLLHRLAADIVALDPRQLRPVAVQHRFHQRLQEALSENSSWAQEDRDLIQEYFRANAG